MLEIHLLGKALMEYECNLETVDNGGKPVLLNTNETAVSYDIVN